MRIFNEGKTHFNSLIHGRPNDGQTLGLIALMLNHIDSTKRTVQSVFVAATREAARMAFKQANELAKQMDDGIECSLVNFDEQIGPSNSHCLIGTSLSLSKRKSNWYDVRIVIFDDAYKSMSFETDLLKLDAKYVCVSAHISRKLVMISQKLNALQLKRSVQTLLSPNLRHLEFFCTSQAEKLYATIELCKWKHAEQIIIFVLVSKT